MNQPPSVPANPPAGWAARLPAIYAVVTLGMSEVVFDLILRNRDEFPSRGSFHLWVLIWAQVVPFAVLAAVDSLLARRGTDRRGFRLWRAALYAATLLSFLRQLQVSYPGIAAPLAGAASPILVGGLLVLLFLGLGLRAPVPLARYFTVLGVLALIVTGRYVWSSGALSPASREARTDAASRWSGPPVYVLVFDEMSYEVLLKGDRVDAGRFPNLSALADESAWFTCATTNHMWTTHSIPTLLTGRLEPAPGTPSFVRRLPPGCDVLMMGFLGAQRWVPEGPAGPRTVQWRGALHTLGETPRRIPPVLAAALLQSGFIRAPLNESRVLNLPDPHGWQGMEPGDFLLGELSTLLDSVDAREAPGRLTYWHCMLPHTPFIYAADGTLHGRRETCFAPPKPGFESYDPNVVLSNYREQVRFVDTLVGRFIDRLKNEGLYDRSVIVITSDHGLRCFWGELEPPGYPAVLGGFTPRIPLLIHGPSVKPGRYDVDYQHIDFAPTLLNVLGCPFDPAEFEGVSAFARERPARPKVMLDRRGNRRYELDETDGFWRLAKTR